MFKSKKSIAVIISVITLILLMIIWMFFSKKSKVSGGYSDVLQNNNVELRIVASNLYKEKDKTILEVSTSIWNKNGNSIDVKTNDFNLNAIIPQNDFRYTLNKDERITVRQIYEYSGPVTNYSVQVGSQKFNFDFTLKNNELQNKNLKLVSNSIDQNDAKLELEKQANEAKLKRDEAIKKALEEKEKLEKEAEKLKKEEESKAVVIFDIFGKYNSETVGDLTSIVLNADLSANVHIACSTEVNDIFVSKLERTDEQLKVTLKGEYTYQNKKRTITFKIKQNILTVESADFACLSEVKYYK